MSPFLKSKINFYYLICMFALLFIHNYNFAPYVITPSTTIHQSFNASNFIELLFSNSLLRFRMGILMGISGYLMANSQFDSYYDMIAKKATTLLIPFAIISVLGLGITMLFDVLIYGVGTNIGILGKPVWAFTLRDCFNFTLMNPAAFQLWYLKIIFIMAAISPIIKAVLAKFPIHTLVVLTLIWLFTNYLDGETRDRAFVFYVFGFYLRMYNKDVLTPIRFFKAEWALTLFIAIGLLRTTMAYAELDAAIHVKYWLTLLYKINEVVGAYAIWFGFDKLIVKAESSTWFQKYGKCSFFIYAFHAPLINCVSEWVNSKHLYHLPHANIVFYVLIPAILIYVLTNTDIFIKAHFPVFYSLLTGGRGGMKAIKFSLPQFYHPAPLYAQPKMAI